MLDLQAEAADPAFVRFLEVLAEERGQAFTTMDLLVLDGVRRGIKVQSHLTARAGALVDAGALERTGRGKLDTRNNGRLGAIVGRGGAQVSCCDASHGATAA